MQADRVAVFCLAQFILHRENYSTIISVSFFILHNHPLGALESPVIRNNAATRLSLFLCLCLCLCLSLPLSLCDTSVIHPIILVVCRLCFLMCLVSASRPCFDRQRPTRMTHKLFHR